MAGLCESAEPAAVLDVFDVRPSLSTFEAADAALRPVTFDFAIAITTFLPPRAPARRQEHERYAGGRLVHTRGLLHNPAVVQARARLQSGSDRVGRAAN